MNLLQKFHLNKNLLLKADLIEKKQKFILKKNLKLYLKMDKKIIKFDDTEIEEYKFHQNISPISINDIDINKIVVSRFW